MGICVYILYLNVEWIMSICWLYIGPLLNMIVWLSFGWHFHFQVLYICIDIYMHEIRYEIDPRYSIASCSSIFLHHHHFASPSPGGLWVEVPFKIHGRRGAGFPMIPRQWYCRVCYVSPPRNIGEFRSRYSTSLQLTAKRTWQLDGWKMKFPPSAMSLRVVHITSKGLKGWCFQVFSVRQRGPFARKHVWKGSLPTPKLFVSLFILFVFTATFTPAPTWKKRQKHVSRLTQNISHGKLPQVLGITKGVTFF